MHMGFPRLLTSDQGGELIHDLDRKMMKTLGIKHHFTTPYHPQVMCILCMNLVLINLTLACESNGLDEMP